MSEFMIHRKPLRKYGGDLEHSVKRRNTETFSEEDIINILEEVTTRTRIGSSRVNLKSRSNTPWKDSVDKNPKKNSNNMKYESEDIIRKCHIFQRTTHLANLCPRKGKINEIDIEKEPDVEKDDHQNSLLPFKRQIQVRKLSPVNLDLEKLNSEQLNEAEISLHLTDKQESELSVLLYDHKEAFASEKETLRAIVGHEVDIILNIKRPYPPLLRRPAYPETPKCREALELDIKELPDLSQGLLDRKQEFPGTEQSGNSLGRPQKNKENKNKELNFSKKTARTKMS
ncbi:hypothetical protein O181_115675 [Austropuccinia psidii MF-1]|uniref:Uncharacterized protein n=1 Tax=Austropuccinia psidii MF-1 TaxID=1389203 RepID=A0A9Q3PWP7_9BASI|nr:hypothetical protein [Austropuccinia psidii MF-1]